jgi:SAM-dependent methyltransferase
VAAADERIGFDSRCPDWYTPGGAPSDDPKGTAMPEERVIPLDPKTFDMFALKGTEGENTVPPMFNANGLTVRRVMQLIRDFSGKPFEQLEILDLACGEGVYAIEAALRGATVRALDARTERMNEGVDAARRLGLANLTFEQMDIRQVTRDSHGNVDIVLFLGILYHLHHSDSFSVLKNIYELSRQFVIIDTHVALKGDVEIAHDHRVYEGCYYREHAESDSEQVRRSRLLASIDNTTSFWFTKESLFRLLKEVGFTSVCECSVPLDPLKAEDRITLIASKGEPVRLSSYPWINEKAEHEIENLLESDPRGKRRGRRPIKRRAESWINGALRPFGLKMIRI